jgi:hypothetical protein
VAVVRLQVVLVFLVEVLVAVLLLLVTLGVQV